MACIVHEASVSIPLTDLQTRLIAGQIPDWTGYEYLPPTLNKLITHNLLFDFTLPTAYTGAGVDITSGKWISRRLANMNQIANHSAAKGRCSPTASTTRRVNSRASASPACMARRQLRHRLRRRRFHCQQLHHGLFEVDAYFVRGDWTLQGQLSYGQQKDAAITAKPGELLTARWWGLSGRPPTR